MRIQADQLDIYEIDEARRHQGEGGRGRGNVVFLEGEERLAGDRLDDGPRHRPRRLRERPGYVEPGRLRGGRDDRARRRRSLPGRGRQVHRRAPSPTRAGASAPARPPSRWTTRSSAKNVVFKVKAVPAFYFPTSSTPSTTTSAHRVPPSPLRATPRSGLQHRHGLLLGHGPQRRPDLLRGPLLEGRLRPRPRAPLGRGAPRAGPSGPTSSAPRTATTGTTTSTGTPLQMLPGKVRASLHVRRYSSMSFQPGYKDNFNLATSRTQRVPVNFQQNLSGATFSSWPRTAGRFFGDRRLRVNRRLPCCQIRQARRRSARPARLRASRRAGRGPRPGQPGAVDRLLALRLRPRALAPLSRLTFLQLNPRVGVRYTRWSDHRRRRRHLHGPGPRSAAYLEGSLEMRVRPSPASSTRPGGSYTDGSSTSSGPR